MDQQQTNPFWNERPEQARHVVDWLHADAVSDLLADIATSASSDLSSDAPIALQAVSRE